MAVDCCDCNVGHHNLGSPAVTSADLSWERRGPSITNNTAMVTDLPADSPGLGLRVTAANGGL